MLEPSLNASGNFKSQYFVLTNLFEHVTRPGATPRWRLVQPSTRTDSTACGQCSCRNACDRIGSVA